VPIGRTIDSSGSTVAVVFSVLTVVTVFLAVFDIPNGSTLNVAAALNVAAPPKVFTPLAVKVFVVVTAAVHVNVQLNTTAALNV
jgi:hypothetical protein